MYNSDSIFVFIFIFSILVSLKSIFKIFTALLQTEPKPLIWTNKEILILGISISYIITYLIQK